MTKKEKLSRKLKMGMVGGGRGAFIGNVHVKAATLEGGVDFVAGALSSDPEKARLSGKDYYLRPNRIYDNFKAMAEAEKKLPEGERIDFVTIATPNHLHFEIAKTFLEAGFNVICDKPMTFNLKEAKELRRIVKASGKVFALTHNYTGYPMVKEARELVKKEELGRILKIIVEYPQGWLLKPIEKIGQKQAEWRTDPKKSGATCCVGDIGTHAENLVHYITGLEIEEMAADLTTFIPGRRLEDDANILVHFKGGARGILYASQISAGEENDFTIRVYGMEGSLKWRQEEPNYLIVKRPDKPREILSRGNSYLSQAALRATRLPPGHPEGFIEGFANIYKNATDTIRAGLEERKPTELELDFPDVEDGIRGLAFVETVVKSARAGGKWTKMVNYK